LVIKSGGISATPKPLADIVNFPVDGAVALAVNDQAPQGCPLLELPGVNGDAGVMLDNNTRMAVTASVTLPKCSAHRRCRHQKIIEAPRRDAVDEPVC
jgi:hypothetical protein